MKKYFPLSVLLLACLFANPLLCAEDTVKTLKKEFNRIDKQVKGSVSPETLDGLLVSAVSLRTAAADCMVDQRKTLSELKDQQASALATESGGSDTAERIKLSFQARKTLETCETLNRQANVLVGELNKKQQQRLKGRLLTKQANIFVLLSEFDFEPFKLFKFKGVLGDLSEIKVSDFIFLGILLLVATAIGFGLRSKALKYERSLAVEEREGGTSGQLLRVILGKQALWLLPVYGLVLMALVYAGYSLTNSYSLTALVIAGLLSAFVMIRWIKQVLALELPDQITRFPILSLDVLVSILAVTYLLFESGFFEFVNIQFGDLLHIALFTATFVVLANIFRCFAGVFSREKISTVGFKVGVVLLLGLWLAEIVGFHNLVQYLIFGITGSLAALTLYRITRWMIRDALNAIDHGDGPIRDKARRIMGVEKGGPWPGLMWVRLFLTLGLVGLVGIALLHAWRVSSTGFSLVVEYLVDGFELGAMHVSPVKLLFGIFVIAVLLMVFRAVRQAADRSLKRSLVLDPAAREATITLLSYVGFAVAILMGLSAAGVNLSSLAFVAGALSLGIGFGLQNIVNNFVSGIILLFERPVRRGDWVKVGGTEGRVKKIRVRSTEIRTFDGSDVIVPNAEFISQQVSNVTLRDVHGRIIIPIGVAYGSDVRLVESLLNEVAEENLVVLKHFGDKSPKVLFRGFGDSALNFELRVFIQDVAKKLEIESELNFAVDEKFRSHSISIPFPQRDIHVIPGGAI